MKIAKYLLLGLGSSLALASPVLAERPAKSFERSSQWIFDFASDRCRLMARFGDEDNKHVLFFDQYYPSATAGLTLAGAAFRRFRSRAQTDLSFYDGQEALETEPFTGDFENFGKAVIYSNVGVKNGTKSLDPIAAGLPQLDLEQANLANYISVRQRGRAVRFETGSLRDPFDVLNACTRQMVSDWGLDIDKHMQMTRRPVWLNEQGVTNKIQRRYPSSALRRGEQAILRMRVIIDETGKVETCEILEATSTKKLESPACLEMQDAEFSPALDAQGKPFRSYYATSITYQTGS